MQEKDQKLSASDVLHVLREKIQNGSFNVISLSYEKDNVKVKDHYVSVSQLIQWIDLTLEIV